MLLRESRSIEILPSLDAHAHIDLTRTMDELVEADAVIALTGSLGKASLVIGRHDPYIAWVSYSKATITRNVKLMINRGYPIFLHVK